MDWLLSATCFFLALIMLVAGFALLMVGPPEENVDLHRARASGEEEFTEILEEHLARRQWKSRILVTGLFVGAGMLTLLAFVGMRSSNRGELAPTDPPSSS